MGKIEKNRQIYLIHILKIKGRLASIVAVENLDAREPHFIRSLYVVRGNVQDMDLEGIDKNKIAYISYSGTKGGNGFISYISTNPDFERMHIGRSLMGYVFREMKLNKIEKVDSVCTKTDEQSKRFLESMGFRIVPSAKGGGVYTMAISLNSAEAHDLCIRSEWAPQK